MAARKIIGYRAACIRNGVTEYTGEVRSHTRLYASIDTDRNGRLRWPLSAGDVHLRVADYKVHDKVRFTGPTYAGEQGEVVSVQYVPQAGLGTYWLYSVRTESGHTVTSTGALLAPLDIQHHLWDATPAKPATPAPVAAVPPPPPAPPVPTLADVRDAALRRITELMQKATAQDMQSLLYAAQAAAQIK
ncbi:hypothetical protein Axy23_013 [Achromobacter phage vB_AxyP_19-32_Axy23]|uniref:Uncharacterized protein n=1 Tax=Achromobacter phage vB_AxyP_19-32_Axy23 TaxID=2591047 RepID=A0A514CW62_9CAUD|nr:hypothetical protein Axy23_013 [Achromobacter phage vB_AxyP_19-32_Axy23]